jgi:DNA adenine methylase
MNLFGEVSGAKPFLKWAGGKRQLIPAIEAALPVGFAQKRDLTYVEPFVGGGAVLFWILQAYPNIKQAVINDINPDLSTAYETVKNQAGELIKSLSLIQDKYYSLSSEDDKRAYFMDAREEFNTRSLGDLRNTTLLIFLNRTCFNGLYRVNSKNKFNVPFGKYDKPNICDCKTLIANSHLLKKVTVLNGDFSKSVESVQGGAFVYFDPPYKALNVTASFNAYSSESFDDASQQRLATYCQTLDDAGHNWLLSNSDVKNTDSDNHFFDDMYSGFCIQRVKASRRINSVASKRGDISELLISNYSRDLVFQP